MGYQGKLSRGLNLRETPGPSILRASSLKPQASSLKPQASSLKPQASSLKPQASSLKPQASSLKPQASSLKPQASSLKPQASSLKPQASSLKPQASSLKPQASSLKPQASSLKPQASSLKPQASSLKPQASSLKPQASSLKPQASSLKPQASSLKPQASSLKRIDRASGWSDSPRGRRGNLVRSVAVRLRRVAAGRPHPPPTRWHSRAHRRRATLLRATPWARAWGASVTANIPNRDPLAYMLEADDGNGGGDSIAVTINVTDLDEKLSMHPAPTLVCVSNPHRPSLGDHKFRRVEKHSREDTDDPHD